MKKSRKVIVESNYNMPCPRTREEWEAYHKLCEKYKTPKTWIDADGNKWIEEVDYS